MSRIIRVLEFCPAVVLLLLVNNAIGQPQGPARPTSPPHWIWSRDTCGNVDLSSTAAETCRLERRFQLDQRPRSATLRLAADFCEATIEINGRPVRLVEAGSEPIWGILG